MENETLSFIDIETGLSNCINTRLNKANINLIRFYLNSLNSDKFSNMLLSVNYLKKLVNPNSKRQRQRISEIIQKAELKKVTKNQYITEFKGTGVLKSKKQLCFITL